MIELDIMKKRAIFKALSAKSQFLVGQEFGFEKYYKSQSGVINAVNRIYKEIKENPQEFAITPDVMDLVEKSMLSRRSTKTPSRMVDPGEVNEKELVIGAKNKVWVLLNKKLDYLAKNKRAFKAESIMSIAKVAGIVFDKSQISKGEATEHIALKAKIDNNITSGEALEALLKVRETVNANDND